MSTSAGAHQASSWSPARAGAARSRGLQHVVVPAAAATRDPLSNRTLFAAATQPPSRRSLQCHAASGSSSQPQASASAEAAAAAAAAAELSARITSPAPDLAAAMDRLALTDSFRQLAGFLEANSQLFAGPEVVAVALQVGGRCGVVCSADGGAKSAAASTVPVQGMVSLHLCAAGVALRAMASAHVRYITCACTCLHAHMPTGRQRV